VLLPVVGLVRRADAVVVIGAALAAKAAGVGHRRIAVRLGRPAGTVRGWLRRFGARAEAVRVAFTALLCRLDADPPVIEPAGRPVADAVAAVRAAAGAVVRRWGEPVFGLSAWELAAAVTGGRLLLPGFRVESTVDTINTSCPW
jgi:hypothetical protein